MVFIRKIYYLKNEANRKMAKVRSLFIFTTFLTLALSFSCLILKAGSSNQNVQLKDVFSKSETKILKIDFEQFHKKEGKINYTINLGKYGNHHLVLETIHLLSDKLEQQNSKDEANIPQNYIGQIANKPYSKVALTVNQNFISGFIEYNKTSIYFEPLYHFDKHAKTDEIIIYNKDDVKTRITGCAHNHESHSLKVANQANSLKKSAASCSDYTVEIFLVADYDMFVKHDRSFTKVKNKIESVLIGAKANYDNEFNDPIKFEIVDYYISTSEAEDLWSVETNADKLLAEFSTADFTNEIYDLATLWVTRQLWINEDGQRKEVDGYAYYRGLCKVGQKYNLVEDNNISSATLQTVYAHEIGHNFGAVHDTEIAKYIMSSSVGSNGWSTASLNDINNFYPTTNCLCSTQFIDLEVGSHCPQISANGISNKSVTVKNIGNQVSTATKIGLLLSTDNDITTTDYLAKTIELDPLNPGESKNNTIALDFSDAELPDGIYHYAFIADVDNIINEANENNNLGCKGTITIGSPPIVGDVNVDGKITILDASIVAQYSVQLRIDGDCEDLIQGEELCLEQADMNRDGLVDIRDAYKIARCAVGLDGCTN